MNVLELSALVLVCAALFATINHRFIRLPTTIGVIVVTVVASLLVVLAGRFGPPWILAETSALVSSLEFDKALMQGMLSFLLFAGALHVNLDDLLKQKAIISITAVIGTLGSTFLNGFVAYLVFGWLGLDISLVYCLVFGALISPTDPIAVMGILRGAGVSKSLETKIAGESLFNDGVAVVVFLVLAGVATGAAEATFSSVSLLLLEEAVGGIVFGLVLGGIGYWLLRGVDDYSVEVLITLAMVAGGYALALAIHVSGPLAMVVSGLIIGNHGRRLAMTDRTREHLDTFWELLDEVLNAVLFLLIGLELIVLTFAPTALVAALILIPLVILTRFIWVGLPVSLLRRWLPFSTHAIKIMTWAGIRGGISVALALSLPASAERETLLTVTYFIVLFSIVVQGLTVGHLVRKLKPE